MCQQEDAPDPVVSLSNSLNIACFPGYLKIIYCLIDVNAKTFFLKNNQDHLKPCTHLESQRILCSPSFSLFSSP